MENNIVLTREVIGNYLSSIRTEKKISKYQITQRTGLRLEIINSIEAGSSSYTIDSLLKYVSGVGVYLFFGDKKNKEDSPLDEKDLMDQISRSDPQK